MDTRRSGAHPPLPRPHLARSRLEARPHACTACPFGSSAGLILRRGGLCRRPLPAPAPLAGLAPQCLAERGAVVRRPDGRELLIVEPVYQGPARRLCLDPPRPRLAPARRRDDRPGPGSGPPRQPASVRHDRTRRGASPVQRHRLGGGPILQPPLCRRPPAAPGSPLLDPERRPLPGGRAHRDRAGGAAQLAANQRVPASQRGRPAPRRVRPPPVVLRGPAPARRSSPGWRHPRPAPSDADLPHSATGLPTLPHPPQLSRAARAAVGGVRHLPRQVRQPAHSRPSRLPGASARKLLRHLPPHPGGEPSGRRPPARKRRLEL